MSEAPATTAARLNEQAERALRAPDHASLDWGADVRSLVKAAELMAAALQPFADLYVVAEGMAERDDPAYADDYKRLRDARAALARWRGEPEEGL